jgi:hypothetical protein
MRELKILTRKVRALASAPDHVCFSLTEDLHGCRSCRKAIITVQNVTEGCLSVPKQKLSTRPSTKAEIPAEHPTNWQMPDSADPNPHTVAHTCTHNGAHEFWESYVRGIERNPNLLGPASDALKSNQ